MNAMTLPKTVTVVALDIIPSFDIPETDAGFLMFLGTLDKGEETYDLYVSHRGEFISRFGDSESHYGSLGTLAPEGTPYAVAKELTGMLLASMAGGPEFTYNHYKG